VEKLISWIQMINREILLEQTEKFIFQTMPKVARSIKYHFHHQFSREHPHTPGQYRALNMILNGHRTVSDLAGIQGVSVPMLSRRVDELVSRGLITRERDPNDRRTVVLSITDKGKESLECYEEMVHEWLRTRLEQLDDGELLQLKESMSVIEKLFDVNHEGIHKD
jgi:DNA-binding MarR family transcriptional regulator